ncbi:DNA-binding response regulator, NarL/FixJ family, contains REC and HTH domains [Microbacterium sp. cf046]|uniref:LuxR C-terminal-related transcriptional regulator n=1 Tax=Microbacterium sp. cf046 TaxID=1761803 RepID=UPI0008EC988D|nr:LuxR C-terminal-related transcriptional regulator [Microbacterium sp. cf046]SFR87105.1 DNA-binding response regulator, NarL/FixJ family, contains REC and HTH domains [Microbacterium sp. cf046]
MTGDAAPRRTDWPFRVRDEIFAHLREPLVSHGPMTIVLRGTAGAGKTRIAREAAAWHRRRGRRVTWIGANGSLQTIPWGAFVGIGDSTAEPVTILRGLSERVGRRPHEQLMPVLICDDAQHLDDRSAAVVAEVAQSASASIVLTVRDGMRVPEAIRILIESEPTVVIRVEELDRAGVADVLTAVLARRIRPSSIDQIHALTRGNFLYLRELVRGEIDASRFTSDGDEWTWHRDTALPEGLTDVIGSLLDSLDPGLRDLVDLLAVASPLRSSVYERVVGSTVIEHAELEGLIRSSRSQGGVELEASHPLYVETARMRMGVHRRMRLSGRLATEWVAADIAEGRTASVHDVLRAARLRLDSELVAPPDRLAAEATLALSVTDLELAERLSRAALAGAEHPEALLALGMALTGQARGAEAKTVLERYAQIAAAGDHDVAMVHGGTLFWPLRRPEDAVAFVESAADSAADSVAIASLRAMRALFAVLLGDAARGLRIASTIGAEADAFGTMVLAWTRTTAFAVQGRSEDAAGAAVTGYEGGGRVPANLRFGVAEMHLTGVRIDGRSFSAVDITRRFVAEASWSDGIGATLERRLRGRAALIESRLQDAVDIFDDLRDDLAPLAPNGLLFSSHLDLAQAHALRGHAGPARAAFEAALEDMHPGYAYLFPEVDIAESLVLAAEGRIDAAVAAARASAERARNSGAEGYESLALAFGAQLGDHAGVRRLRELSERVHGPRVRIALRHAEALQRSDASALEHVSSAYEEMGDLVAAADAAAQGAFQLHAAARTREALRANHRASTLAARAQGARTFALRRLEHAPSLSKREYEIARLAADGLSNRAIADLLGISVRTVEGHILRALAKSGLPNRGALANVALDTASARTSPMPQ